MIDNAIAALVTGPVRDGTPITVQISSPSLTLGIDSIEVARNGVQILPLMTQVDASTVSFVITPPSDGNDHVITASVNGGPEVSTTVTRSPGISIGVESILTSGSFDTSASGSFNSAEPVVRLSTVGGLLPSDIAKFDVFWGPFEQYGLSPLSKPFFIQERIGSELVLYVYNLSEAYGEAHISLRVNGVLQPGGLRVQAAYTGLDFNYVWSQAYPTDLETAMAMVVPDRNSTLGQLGQEFGIWSFWMFKATNPTDQPVGFRVYAPQDTAVGKSSINETNLTDWHSYRLKHKPGSGPQTKITMYEQRGLSHYILSPVGVTPEQRIEFEGLEQGNDSQVIGDALLNNTTEVNTGDRWVVFELDPGASIELRLSVSNYGSILRGEWLLQSQMYDLATGNSINYKIESVTIPSEPGFSPAVQPANFTDVYLNRELTDPSYFGILGSPIGFWEIKDEQGSYLQPVPLDDAAMATSDLAIGVISDEYDQLIVTLDRTAPTRELEFSVTFLPEQVHVVRLYVYLTDVVAQPHQLQSQVTVSRDGYADQVLPVTPSNYLTLNVDAPTTIKVRISISPGATSVVDDEYKAQLYIALTPL